MKYDFKNTRYITSGISSTLPDVLVLLLWQIIDDFVTESSLNNFDVDYLQVLKISADFQKHELVILHQQEEPKYSKTLRYEINDEKALSNLNGLKIFVIDDASHSTMLLAEEY